MAVPQVVDILFAPVVLENTGSIGDPLVDLATLCPRPPARCGVRNTFVSELELRGLVKVDWL